MRILLTGRNGQVGWELERSLAPLGEVVATDHATLDLADPDAIRRVTREVKPAVIVNAGAYTAVDKAESEPELAMRINGVAPGILAEEAKRLGALLVHYSTDYVFDGTKREPYTEEDVPNPINVYGRSKLEGERAVAAAGGRWLVLRTSWVYAARGTNFLRTMLRLAREREVLRVVDDQLGAPTWARNIADATAHLVAATSGPGAVAAVGTYNLCARGGTSWCGFAKAIFSSTVRAPRVEAILTREYPTAATRPLNSRLSTQRLQQRTGLALPPWQSGVRLCLADLGHD